MKNHKDDDFADRRGTAAKAKAAQLHAHRSAKETAESSRLARQEKRPAAATTNSERNAERARVRLEEQERAEAESANRAAAVAADKATAEAAEKGKQDQDFHVLEDEAAKKAERDRRYAERKARKR